MLVIGSWQSRSSIVIDTPHCLNLGLLVQVVMIFEIMRFQLAPPVSNYTRVSRISKVLILNFLRVGIRRSCGGTY